MALIMLFNFYVTRKKQINHQIIQEKNSDPKAAELNYDGFTAKSNMYKKP